jgi:hypothetical protein
LGNFLPEVSTFGNFLPEVLPLLTSGNFFPEVSTFGNFLPEVKSLLNVTNMLLSYPEDERNQPYVTEKWEEIRKASFRDHISKIK